MTTPHTRKAFQDPSPGSRFGRLTVLCRVDGSRRRKFSCRCDCGNTTSVQGWHLLTGHTKSCGCLALEVHSTSTRSHGLSKTLMYNAWCSMRSRCENPNNAAYTRYGGRGISVCERWQRFENFVADMGPRPSAKHSIDRIDNNGDYEPGNCRWATPLEQSHNSRKANIVTCNGESTSVSQWAEKTGLSRETIGDRLKRGWSAEEAISAPPINKRPHILNHNGTSACVSEWARILGIPRHQIAGRLRRGWSVERTLETPRGHR